MFWNKFVGRNVKQFGCSKFPGSLWQSWVVHIDFWLALSPNFAFRGLGVAWGMIKPILVFIKNNSKPYCGSVVVHCFCLFLHPCALGVGNKNLLYLEEKRRLLLFLL